MSKTKKLNELFLSEGIEILLQAEEENWKQRRFQRLDKQAVFQYKASLEERQTQESHGINKSLVAPLATCEFIEKGESVLITGATKASTIISSHNSLFAAGMWLLKRKPLQMQS